MSNKKLVFVSSNTGKIQEISSKLDIPLLGLKDIGCNDEIPETGVTFRENAEQKARFVYERYGLNCFADDSGLEVDVLQGDPGIHTAYYGGPQRSADDNMQKLLSEMDHCVNRKARFVCCIALIVGGEVHFFEGHCDGHILREKRGTMGFGYDPIFMPVNNSRSFAEMRIEEKNYFSHRALAIQRMEKALIFAPFKG